MCSMGLASRLCANGPIGRVRTFMRQPLVFSLSWPPRSHPGRFGYAQGVLRTLRYAVVPLGCPGLGARSRRNLDV